MSGGGRGGAHGRLEHGEDGGAVGEDRRLRVVGGGERVLGPLEHHLTQPEPERVVDGLEGLSRGGKPRGQVFAHPDFLGALPRTQPHGLAVGYHCKTMLAHVKPAPNATNITFMPGASRPVRTASSSAIATEAAEVLP